MRASATSTSGLALERELTTLSRPILILSTAVGRGMYSIGEALEERLGKGPDVHHMAVEEVLPRGAVQEDLERYRLISDKLPVLLNIPYRFPPVYWRKLVRERHGSGTDLRALDHVVRSRGIRTVLCVSHRPTFWTTCWKDRNRADVEVVGLLGEFGSNLGWRYLSWARVDRFLTPVPAEGLRFTIPEHVRVAEIALPVRHAFEQLETRPGDRSHVLVVCGFWGQGPMLRVIRSILQVEPSLRIHAVCGDNAALKGCLEARKELRPSVRCYGAVDSLLAILAQCGSVVTKPGISTLLEAHAAGRKIFLLRGMPVAEDNNLRFALRSFGAERFDPRRFGEWLRSCQAEAEAALTGSLA